MTASVNQTSNSSPKILDVGCGQNKYPGAIGIDSNPRADADVIHDLGVLPYPFADNEFDEIICRHVIEHVPDVMFAAEVDGGRLLHSPGWPIHNDDREVAFPVGIEELTATQIVKLQARAPGQNSDSFKRIVTKSVGDLVEVTCPGYDGLVEMTQRGVTKASALAVLAAGLGIHSADALAFGDMPNDISMLRWAGRSVAVANAHPDARAAAGEMTLSNLDDGVAVYLERLLSGMRNAKVEQVRKRGLPPLIGS